MVSGEKYIRYKSNPRTGSLPQSGNSISGSNGRNRIDINQT